MSSGVPFDIIRAFCTSGMSQPMVIRKVLREAGQNDQVQRNIYSADSVSPLSPATLFFLDLLTLIWIIAREAFRGVEELAISYMLRSSWRFALSPD